MGEQPIEPASQSQHNMFLSLHQQHAVCSCRRAESGIPTQADCRERRSSAGLTFIPRK